MYKYEAQAVIDGNEFDQWEITADRAAATLLWWTDH